MDDLIYSFLIQSGYPRSSIVADIDLLGAAAQMSPSTKAPTFVIVDPDTADLLAVLEVVDAVNGDVLRQVAIETGAYASRLGGKTLQGFVIRVDVKGTNEAEQVQFYRVWPNSTLQQLSSKTFPDLGSLKVARKLSETSVQRQAVETHQTVEKLDDEVEPPRAGMGLYIPASILFLIVIIESVMRARTGEPLMSVSQSILALGAAALFTLPAAIRYLRR